MLKRQCGFRFGERVWTPKGNATVIGLCNINVASSSAGKTLYDVWVHLDGDRGVSYWGGTHTRDDFEMLGVRAITPHTKENGPPLALKQRVRIVPEYTYTAYSSLIGDSRFADCFFVVGCERRVFYAHKAVLCAARFCCPLFEAMLANNMMVESREKQSRIELPEEIECETFEDILQFLYTGRTRRGLTRDNCLHIMMAANYMCMESLLLVCEEYVKSILDETNVEAFFEFSKSTYLAPESNTEQMSHFSSGRLYKLCSSFLVNLVFAEGEQ